LRCAAVDKSIFTVGKYLAHYILYFLKANRNFLLIIPALPEKLTSDAKRFSFIFKCWIYSQIVAITQWIIFYSCTYNLHLRTPSLLQWLTVVF